MRVGNLVDAAVVGYLLGTIPSADLIAARASAGRVDIRAEGSGNPGALNTAQILGAKWGAAVLAADMAKGVAAAGVGRALAGGLGQYVAATSAVVGHCFPVWNGFRGGKGVATAIGEAVSTFPAFVPIGAGLAGATLAVPGQQRRTFNATIVAGVAATIAGVVWWVKGLRNLWGPKPNAALPIAAAATTGVMVYRFVTAAKERAA